MWVAFGAHLWVLAAGSLPPPPDLFFLSVGAYSVAWVVGFVIVVLPAGAGPPPSPARHGRNGR